MAVKSTDKEVALAEKLVLAAALAWYRAQHTPDLGAGYKSEGALNTACASLYRARGLKPLPEE